jgi:hypothetical protein
MRLLATAAALIFCFLSALSSVQAGDLNQQYGPSWTCLSIDARDQALYQACLPCQQSGQDFYEDSDSSGHCVPKPGAQTSHGAPVPIRVAPPPPPPVQPVSPPPPRRAYWGAIAGATWKDGSGEHASDGTSWDYRSKSQAISAALSQCQQAGGGSQCKIVGTFSNGGCGYISIGNGDASFVQGRACYGSGNTAAAAENSCHTAGCMTCKPADGGCTQRP